MATTMEDYKKQKSKYIVAKSNCTIATKKLNIAWEDFSKSGEIQMRKIRFAAQLIEAVDFCKEKNQGT